MGVKKADSCWILEMMVASICSVLVAIFEFISPFWKRDERNLPPRRGMKSSRDNAAILTTIDGAAGMYFLKSLSKEAENGSSVDENWSGSLFRLSIPFISTFIICTDYKIAHLILEGDNSENIEEAEKSTFQQQYDMYPGRPSILSSLTSNPYRQERRKFMAHAFSMRNLANAFKVVHEHLVASSSYLDKKIADKETILLGDFMLRLTLGAIVHSAFGAKLNTLSEGSDSPASLAAQYMHHQDTYVRFYASRLMKPWEKYMFWTEEFVEKEKSRHFRRWFAAKLAKTYRAQHTDSDFSGDGSIMGHLLRFQFQDERDLHSDILAFLGAGHETTGWSAVWLILEIARHPEVRKKLQVELDQHIPARRDADGNLLADVAFPSNAELFSLPYLSMCIKEAMRLWPVAASGPRRVLQRDLYVPDNTNAKDSAAKKTVLLPKGATVQVNFFSMFRAGWIDRPEEFIPERWAPENPQLPRLKEMLMPFSLGRRNCIGQNLANVQLTMISAYLLRYYEFKLISDPKAELFVTLKAQNAVMELSHRL